MKKSTVAVIFALLCSGVFIVWVMTSQQIVQKNISPNEEPQSSSQTSQAPELIITETTSTINPINVSMKLVERQFYVPHYRVAGTTEISQRITIRAEIDGIIAQLNAAEGDLVTKSQSLAQIAGEDHHANLTESRAMVNHYQKAAEAADNLKARGFESEVKQTEAQFNLERARANLERARLALKKLSIHAPNNMIVEQRAVEVGDFVRKGDILFQLIIIDPIEVDIQVSEWKISQFKLHDLAEITLPSSRMVEGKVSYISSVANSQTRTFTVTVTASNADNLIRAGLTSEVILKEAPQSAFFIPSSALILDDQGIPGIYIVDDQERAQFKPVKILSDIGTGVWVSSLQSDLLLEKFAEIKLIIRGQGFLIKGQKVIAINIDTTKETS